MYYHVVVLPSPPMRPDMDANVESYKKRKKKHVSEETCNISDFVLEPKSKHNAIVDNPTLVFMWGKQLQ